MPLVKSLTPEKPTAGGDDMALYVVATVSTRASLGRAITVSQTYKTTYRYGSGRGARCTKGARSGANALSGAQKMFLTKRTHQMIENKGSGF